LEKKRALYAGTFDPFTNGHLDIVQRAIKIFDEIIVLVAVSPTKKPFMSTDVKTGWLVFSSRARPESNELYLDVRAPFHCIWGFCCDQPEKGFQELPQIDCRNFCALERQALARQPRDRRRWGSHVDLLNFLLHP
jgi:cytidyltransferase-like protein